MSEYHQGGRDYGRGVDGGYRRERYKDNNFADVEECVRGDSDSNYVSAHNSKRRGTNRKAEEWVPKPEEPCPPPPIVEGYTLEGLEAMPSSGINYEKNIYECYVCNSWTNTEIMLNTHLEGKIHIRKLEQAGYNSFMPPRPLGPIPGIQAIKDEKWKTGEKRTYSEIDPTNKGSFCCKVCDKPFDSRIVYETHMKGKPHARMLKAKEEMIESEDLSMSCLICHFVGTSAVNLEIHLQGKKHKKRVEDAKKGPTSMPVTKSSVDQNAPKMLSQLHSRKK